MPHTLNPLPNIESPVPELTGTFQFVYALNIFYPLGKATKGRYHVVIFFKSPLGSTVYITNSNPFTYTSYCQEFMLTDKGGLVIGVLFAFDESRAHLSPYKLYVGNTDVSKDMTGFPVASEVAGTHAYCSDNGILLIPAYVNDAPFVIQDEKD